MSLYLIGGVLCPPSCVQCVPSKKSREIIEYESKSNRFVTCCAVSSAAFAYQNNPQGQHVVQGAQFVTREDPGVNPPKAAVMEDPGVESAEGWR